MRNIYKKLNDVNSILNDIEVKAQRNIVLLANAFVYLQDAMNLLENEIMNTEGVRKEKDGDSSNSV